MYKCLHVEFQPLLEKFSQPVMRCVAVVYNIGFLRQSLRVHMQTQLLYSFLASWRSSRYSRQFSGVREVLHHVRRQGKNPGKVKCNGVARHISCQRRWQGALLIAVCDRVASRCSEWTDILIYSSLAGLVLATQQVISLAIFLAMILKDKFQRGKKDSNTLLLYIA
jgi:hypothetical protein